MDQTAQYRQLQPEDRMTITSMKQNELKARTMARALGWTRHPGSLKLAHREIWAVPEY